jgi:hypothetical protein
MSKTKMSKKEMESIAFRNAAIDRMTQTEKRLYNLEKSSTKKKANTKSGSKIRGLMGLSGLNLGTYKPFS